LDNGRFVTVLINTLKMPMEIGDGIAACVETVRRGLFDYYFCRRPGDVLAFL
jgi:hypothetical protein